MKICLFCKFKFSSDVWKCPRCNKLPATINNFLSFEPTLEIEKEDFPVDFFNELFELESSNFWFQSRNQLIIWALGNYFAYPRNFLEIGCGTGFVLQSIEKSFPHLSCYGSEIHNTGLALASKRLNNSTLFQMDARNIPFEDEFDVIGSFDVIEHIDEDELVLSQIFKAIHRGGGIVLTVPQHPFLWSQYDDFSHHKRRYTRKELISKVMRAGFKVLKITSFISFLLPLMVRSRIKRKKRGKFNPKSYFNINPWINIMLERILDLERSFIKSGISFYAGGSLLLIGKKV